LKTTDRGGAVRLEVRHDIATLGYSVIIDGVKNVEQFCDASRRLDGHNQLPKIILGVRFNDGIEVVKPKAQDAAA
jgi:hypothetical protein